MKEIKEIRELFFQLMDQECRGENLVCSTNCDIESQQFMLEEHAQATREACIQGGYYVSFRESGRSTLKLMRNGNPCKGHDIADKSIRKSDDNWNYIGQEEVLSRLEGCIGFSLNDQLNELHGVWVESENKPTRTMLKQVDSSSNRCYTGDYDMHDLLKYRDAKFSQIIPETQDENEAIDHFNRHLLATQASEIRLKTDNNRRSKIELFLQANKDLCSKHCCDSLIRHGAQTSYWFYLHCEESSTELEKTLSGGTVHDFIWKNNILNISTPICFFNTKGEAHILNNIYQVYLYYKVNDILEQIPFIYFLQTLRDISKSNHKLSTTLKRHSLLISKWAEEYFI